MTIYALGDLHFSGDPPQKPMTKFGEHWGDHRAKILKNWQEKVRPEDLIVLCGDLSWAMTLEEARPDLQCLADLPGHKLLLKGNHDYWWTSLKKMQQAWGQAFFFLQNDFYPWGETAVCGTRGWILPGCEGFKADDEKRLRREALRLQLSLDAARQSGFSKILAVLHYPPFYQKDEPSPFRTLLEEYQVRHCVFGHIHGAQAAAGVFQGESGGCHYRLVSCDTVGFAPVKIEID